VPPPAYPSPVDSTLLGALGASIAPPPKKNIYIFGLTPLQEDQLSPSDRAMRLVSCNLANCHATVQKLLMRQVLTKLMV